MSKRIISLLLVLVMLVGCMASCNWFKKDPVEEPDAIKQAVYNTTTSVMPSNWNELTYADNNDTQIMSYIGSSFFTYDYKFENDQKYNADGSINKDAIVDGAFTVNYDAATKLEDVTATVDAKWGYTDEQKAEGGYAWKITLRDDLKWDDGTPITAADFEYSMKAQLDPAFMNFRANTYYDTLMVKNSRNYFFQNAPIYESWLDTAGYFENYNVNSDGYATVTIDGVEQVIYTSFSMAIPFFGANTINDYAAAGYVDAGYFSVPAVEELDYNNLPSYVEVYDDEEDETKKYYYVNLYDKYADAANEFGAIALTPTAVEEFKYLALVFGDENPVAWNEFCLYVAGHGTATPWESVGMYSIPEENAIVLCLDKAYSLLNEDGSLALWAAYYMSGLPLVKQSLYESCKKDPAAGATLYTSNYNSSLATTASWGPYKLVEFEAGSHYKLVKNEHWFGWNMEEYKNQYNVSSIYCRKVDKEETVWMGFLSGEYDDAAIYAGVNEDYADSKYISYSEGSTGTFGMQIFSDLNTLKTSGNNNGILAILEFRQAFNLALNRSDIVETIWPGTATPCFGLVNTAYYYDVEGAPNLADGGKYRNSVQAKEGILRAYGYTQGADGKWSINDLTGLTTDDAYDTLTGYNLTLAKEKMAAAVAELTNNAETYGYDPTKDITIVYGSSSDTDKQRFRCEYLQGVINTLVEGTALQGKIKLVFDASAGSQWAEAFRSGKTQIGFGYGFSGNPFNPFDIVGAFVNPEDSLNYHMYWDTTTIDMTLTMPAGNYAGAGETITMSVMNWYCCLNGLANEYEQAKTYNWGEGFAPVEARLAILSALEEVVIKESRSVMLIGDSGGSFLGAKFSNFSDSYNTFMGFGGIRYLVVEYTDAEWSAYVSNNGNDLSAEYKKSE